MSASVSDPVSIPVSGPVSGPKAAPLHIVTGSDDNYVAGVMVLIASAVWHNPAARFTVLDLGIKPVNRARIDQLGQRLGVQIDRIEIDDAAFANIPVRRSHLTRSTYLRLLIPDLLPDEDRVVYMDCDMVVTTDLSLLAKVELGDAPLAAVACPGPDHRELAATQTKIGEYVNGGLLVMNLPVWRREDLPGHCLDLLSDPEHPLLSEDQSAINIACRGRMILLPPRYNIYANESCYRTPEDLPDEVSVLHYVVNTKPWLWDVSYGEIWQFHADHIRDLLPPRQRSARHYRARIEQHRRNIFGLAMGRRKHWNRLKIRKAIRSGYVTRYLTGQKPA